jgi:phospholipase C
MNRLAHVTMVGLVGCTMQTFEPPAIDDDLAPTVEPVAPGGEAGLTASAIKHVFVIALENHGASDIYGNTTSAPYINQTLMPLFGRATNFIDRLPSLNSEPHYVWMEAGTNAFSDHTFTTDNNPSASNSTASTNHLVTQISAAGSTWLSYQEGLNTTTGGCPIAASGNYAPKHDPFIFFRDVSGATPSKTSAVCVAHHKPLTALAADLANDTVAAYNFITPNLCHDMHSNSCAGSSDPIKQGDTWLSTNVPAIITYVNAHQGVLFIVWDEPVGSTGTIPLIAVGPQVRPNRASSVQYTHGSLVKSVEQILGLPTLATVASDNTFSDFFDAGFFP